MAETGRKPCGCDVPCCSDEHGPECRCCETIRQGMPWLDHEPCEGYVWCIECGSEIYVAEMEWPDPDEREPGEELYRTAFCDAEFGGKECFGDVLIRRVVNEAGDGYIGPAVNARLPGVGDG